MCVCDRLCVKCVCACDRLCVKCGWYFMLGANPAEVFFFSLLSGTADSPGKDRLSTYLPSHLSCSSYFPSQNYHFVMGSDFFSVFLILCSYICTTENKCFINIWLASRCTLYVDSVKMYHLSINGKNMSFYLVFLLLVSSFEF